MKHTCQIHEISGATLDRSEVIRGLGSYTLVLLLTLATATTALAQSDTPPLAPQYIKPYQWNDLPAAGTAQFNRAMNLHQGVLGKDEFDLQAC